MNKAYKVIWSSLRQCYVVVSEKVHNRTKSNVRSVHMMNPIESMKESFKALLQAKGGIPKGISVAALAVLLASGVGTSMPVEAANGPNQQVDTMLVKGENNDPTDPSNQKKIARNYYITTEAPEEKYPGGPYNTNVGTGVAVGYDSWTSTKSGTALGTYAKAAENSVAVGTNSYAEEDSVAVGTSSYAAKHSIAVGASSHAIDYSTAVGEKSVANGTGSAAYGEAAKAYGTRASALGDNAVAGVIDKAGNVTSGNFATAVGGYAKATGNNSTAVGAGQAADAATASGENATALGSKTKAIVANSTALGYGANASVTNSVALGANATTSTASSVSGTVTIGSGSTALTYSADDFAASTNDLSSGASRGVVSVGSKGAERQIQNVAAGAISATSTDAINGSQLYYTAKVLNDNKADKSTQYVYKVSNNAGRAANTSGNVDTWTLGNPDSLSFNATDKLNVSTDGAGNIVYDLSDSTKSKLVTDVQSGKNTTVVKVQNGDGSYTYTVNSASPFEYVTENGDKLVLIDGKLYKSDQLNADGSLKTNAQPYTGNTTINAIDQNGNKQVIGNIQGGSITNGSDQAITGNQLYNYVNVNGTAATNTDGKVNFVNGTNTTVSVDPANGNISYNVANTSLSVGGSGSVNAPSSSNANSFVNASDLTTVLNSMHWNVTSGAAGGTNTGSSVAPVKAGDTVTFIAGDNIKIDQDGKNFTISTTAPTNGQDGKNGDTIKVTNNGDGSFIYEVIDSDGNTKSTQIVKNGVDGAKGDTGAQGIQGEKGDTGAKGDTGSKGDTGAQGIQGEKGDTGAAGRDGVDGKDGKNATASVTD
ncbi:ESPR-type extended signal peptide-containing protein, partial [Veillonella caviae]